MTAWLGTESLDNALSDEGCGCKKILESHKKADASEASVLKEVGTMQAKAWNCPLVCGGKPDATKLEDKHFEAYRAVKRLTRLPVIEEDLEGNVDLVFETCPRYYYDPSTQSGKDAKRVEVAMNWKKNGQFSTVEDPTHKMVQAIDIMEQGHTAVQVHESEKIAKENRDQYDKYMNSKKNEEPM